MNLSEVLYAARAHNKAIRKTDWPEDAYVYHGMDNQLFHNDGMKMSTAVATFLATDWELAVDFPYHGPLADIPEGTYEKWYNSSNGDLS